MAWIAACDAQVPTAYRGEALLTMTGKVEIQDDPTEGRLIPALAWVEYERSQIEISEVEVEGEFPSSFTIHVYDPPSDDMLKPVSDDDDSVLGAAAYITAVTEKHPEAVRFASSSSATASGCAGDDCSCGEQGCISVSEACTADGTSCYKETKTCPRVDSPPGDCEITHSGDEELTQSPWKHFAGLSQNYAIVYVTDAISKNSDLGWKLGLNVGLEKGYNLVALRELNDDERAEQAHCEQDATDEAVAYFNDKLGNPAKTDEELETLYLRLMGLSCNPGCPASDPSCNPNDIAPECEPLDSDLVEAFPGKVEQLEREGGCLNPGAQVRFTPVKDPAHESITVQIAPDLTPIGGKTAERMVAHASTPPMMIPPSAGTP
jgi:hypothetical protein